MLCPFSEARIVCFKGKKLKEVKWTWWHKEESRVSRFLAWTYYIISLVGCVESFWRILSGIKGGLIVLIGFSVIGVYGALAVPTAHFLRRRATSRRSL